MSPNRCDCGEIGVGLGISYAEINEVEAANAELKARCTTESGLTIYSGPDLYAFRTARWKPLCDPCADRVPSLYLIEYDRLHTVEQALDWTLHLCEKVWFPATDWPTVMRAHFPKVRAA